MHKDGPECIRRAGMPKDGPEMLDIQEIDGLESVLRIVMEITSDINPDSWRSLTGAQQAYNEYAGIKI